MKVRRFDIGKLDGASMTSQGFLRARALATRSGIFNYVQADGTVRRELRHPDEVFNPDSMAGLGNCPITNLHPSEPVDNSNARRFAVGWTGEAPERKGDYIEVPVTVMDAEAIQGILTGGREQVSCGYFCDMDETPGEWNGEKYDAVQRNVSYNHLAMVPVGRAGPDAKVRLDAADAVMTEEKTDAADKSASDEEKKFGGPSEKLLISEKKITEDKIMAAKIKIDAVEYEVSETVAQVVNVKLDSLAKANETVAAKQKELDTIQGKLDVADSENKKLRGDLDAAKKSAEISDEQVLERADALLKVRAVGKAILGDEAKVDTMQIAAIKKACVAKELPEVKVDEKSADYITGVFDSLIEKHRADAGDPLKEALGLKADGGGSHRTAEQARDKQRQDAVNGWKTYGQPATQARQ